MRKREIIFSFLFFSTVKPAFGRSVTPFSCRNLPAFQADTSSWFVSGTEFTSDNLIRTQLSKSVLAHISTARRINNSDTDYEIVVPTKNVNRMIVLNPTPEDFVNNSYDFGLEKVNSYSYRLEYAQGTKKSKILNEVPAQLIRFEWDSRDDYNSPNAKPKQIEEIPLSCAFMVREEPISRRLFSSELFCSLFSCFDN